MGMGGSNMTWVFIFCVFISIFTFTAFIGSFFLPKFYYKIRLRTMMSDTEKVKKKEAKKAPKKNSLYTKFLDKLELDIEAAAIPVTPKEFLLILLFCNVFLVLVLSIIASFGKALLFCIVLDIVTFRILPRFQKRRKKLMAEQLPDVLDLISNALKTGYSIVQTIDLVSKENFEPLSTEFRKLVQALKFGEPFEKAFTDLSDRLDMPELTTVVDTILITRETGGNMTHVIDGLLEMIRENQRLQGEVKALTAQGRISAWVIGLLPVLLFALLLLISPEYMMLLFSHPLGIGMLVVATILEVVGFVVMNKLTKLDVR
jgi:tight adherence protein B